jgi:hypothetical protein
MMDYGISNGKCEPKKYNYRTHTWEASMVIPYVMVDFALGGGWPIEGLNKANTYLMQVAYVRCWAPPH